MTFEEYMQKNFPNFNLEDDSITVNGLWLKGLWLAAQKEMVHNTIAALRASNPVKSEVLTPSVFLQTVQPS